MKSNDSLLQAGTKRIANAAGTASISQSSGVLKKSRRPADARGAAEIGHQNRIRDGEDSVQFATFDFTPFQAVSSSVPSDSKPHRSKSSPMSPQPTTPSFTPKQGQYLAFIYAYTRVLGRPPAEADLQRHFGVTPPSVHQMVLTLERAGLIRRQPGVARSIEVLVPPELLPVLG